MQTSNVCTRPRPFHAGAKIVGMDVLWITISSCCCEWTSESASHVQSRTILKVVKGSMFELGVDGDAHDGCWGFVEAVLVIGDGNVAALAASATIPVNRVNSGGFRCDVVFNANDVSLRSVKGKAA